MTDGDFLNKPEKDDAGQQKPAPTHQTGFIEEEESESVRTLRKSFWIVLRVILGLALVGVGIWIGSIAYDRWTTPLISLSMIDIAYGLLLAVIAFYWIKHALMITFARGPYSYHRASKN